MEELFTIVKNNNYVKSYKPKLSKYSVYSLKYYIKRDISHSESIRLGLCLESVFRDIIIKHSGLKCIKQINTKNKHERDHLFKDDSSVFYAEIKSNLCLDTEKSKATDNKCSDIHQELENEFVGLNVKSFLVCLRYLRNSEVPMLIQKKFKTKIFGINDYLSSLGVSIIFSTEEYTDFLNYVFELMISDNL
jgi:hypothetical protein